MNSSLGETVVCDVAWAGLQLQDWGGAGRCQWRAWECVPSEWRLVERPGWHGAAVRPVRVSLAGARGVLLLGSVSRCGGMFHVLAHSRTVWVCGAA